MDVFFNFINVSTYNTLYNIYNKNGYGTMTTYNIEMNDFFFRSEIRYFK